MTDRPRILDLPGGPVVAHDWVRTGWGDSIPLIDAYLGIDTDALKLTALNLYGIPAQHDNTGRSTNPDVDVNLELEGGGKLYVELDALSERILLDFGLEIQNWRGPAFETAENRVLKLSAAAERDGHNARRIGQSLWHFADVLEKGQSDVRAAVLGVPSSP